MGRSERIEFTGSAGDPLAARLDLPDSPPRAYALFAHCFSCSKDTVAAGRIARTLTEFGIAVLRFDFSSNADDLVLAADFLRDSFAAPTVLVGHSLGGAAVLAATERVPEVRAVATIGAPADLAQVAPGREEIAGLGAALLVLHSPVDGTVGVDNARRIFEAARHPKSFVALDGADHLLTRPADATYVATVLAAWAGRYAFDPESGPPPAQPAEGVVEVAETGAGPYAQRVAAGRHILAADEPEPIGADTGPSPYDLLLAALGACTSMTVRMYAARKQWPLEKVTVSLRHARVHAEDCADCETRAGKIDHIDRVIHFEGDLDDAQRQRLLEIASKCPVHRTLRSETVIDTTSR